MPLLSRALSVLRCPVDCVCAPLGSRRNQCAHDSASSSIGSGACQSLVSHSDCARADSHDASLNSPVASGNDGKADVSWRRRENVRIIFFLFCAWTCFILLDNLFAIGQVVNNRLRSFPWFVLLAFWHRWLLAGREQSGKRSLSGVEGMSSTSGERIDPLQVRGSTLAACEIEEASFGTVDCLDAYLQVVEQRIRAESPPSNPSEFISTGWVDCSKGKTNLFIASRPQLQGEPFSRISVCVEANSTDQITSFPLINVDGSGAAQIFLAFEHWNTWFPFCHSCSLVKRISPFRSIWVLKFKVFLFTADCVVLAVLNDKLHSAGCLELIMRSPPPGMEGRTWLGATIPHSTASLRAEMVSFRLATYPQSCDETKTVFQCELYDPLKFKVNPLVKMFWSVLATKLMPLIAGMQARYANSALERHYADASTSGAAMREAFAELRCHLIQAIAARK